MASKGGRSELQDCGWRKLFSLSELAASVLSKVFLKMLFSMPGKTHSSSVVMR